MSVSIGGTTFTTSSIHGTPIIPPWRFQRSAQGFFGVVGEYHVLGQLNAREIVLDFELTGYATLAAINSASTSINAGIGTSGTLSIDVGGGDVSSLTLCTFDGWEPSEAPWKDGSGVNGWQQKGKLHFTQIAS